MLMPTPPSFHSKIKHFRFDANQQEEKPEKGKKWRVVGGRGYHITTTSTYLYLCKPSKISIDTIVYVDLNVPTIQFPVPCYINAAKTVPAAVEETWLVMPPILLPEIRSSEEHSLVFVGDGAGGSYIDIIIEELDDTVKTVKRT